MQLIKDFFKRYPGQCLIVWACLVVASIAEGLSLSTLLPILTIATGSQSPMVDAKTQDFLSQWLHRLSIDPTIGAMMSIVLVGLVFKAVLTLIAYRQVGYTVAAIATEGRLNFLRALSSSRWEYFLSQRTGRLSNTISTEASNSADAFQSMANLASLASQSVVFLLVALLINWKIAVMAVLIGAAIFGVLKVMVSISREAGGRQKNSFQHLMALLTDSLASLKPLKSMAREGQIDRMLERQTRELNGALRTRVMAQETLKALQELLIGVVLIAGVGASLLVWNLQLSEIMVLTIVLARMLTRLSKVQQEYQKLASREAFYWAMNEQIDNARAARETAFGDRRPTLERGVTVERVSFGYEGRSVLHAVDLEIPAGGFTTLIGFSGAGKTTLIDLIIGLLRADEGRILIDGVPIDAIDIRAWRSMIGYVPQDTILLHDSIYNNVVVGDQSLSEEAAIDALKRAGAWSFVSALADGIHTSVGEHGGRLSGGQRQRVVIARALVHQPRLLILDEATSALDPETEAAVSATLADLGKDYTVLAVSHRSALTERSHRVYQLDQGRARPVAAPARASA
ncbi:ABC transporter ATP-binding protein [Salinisphaera sp.]|uniref:ABC transporter ATP-binding protein n=1 Tax=Salinisphaera sp. TaxID=1914330 RepID=UPI002D78EC98|nr:ABC transporter ATP-binding protein [Salinisphaera sp.]HET7313165.1 ABC transporter ATP-binding protein [Salinisphaera sp.]